MTQFIKFCWFYLNKLIRRCEYAGWGNCLCEGKVKPESSRTLYSTKVKTDSFNNPNRSVLLCRAHAQEHHDHWDDMWEQVPKW